MGSRSVGHFLSDFTFTFHFHALEKEMVTNFSVLAWRIPGMGERGGCRLWGRTESDTTDATQQQQQAGHSFRSKEQVSFNFMVAVTICSDFGDPKKIKSDTVSIVSPSISHEVMGPDAMIFVF